MSDILHFSQRSVHSGTKQSRFVLSFLLAVLLWSKQPRPKIHISHTWWTKDRKKTKWGEVNNSLAQYDFITFKCSLGCISIFLLKLHQKLGCNFLGHDYITMVRCWGDRSVCVLENLMWCLVLTHHYTLIYCRLIENMPKISMDIFFSSRETNVC